MKKNVKKTWFTLTETMIAVVLSAVVLASAASLFAVYRRAQVMVVRRANAFSIASGHLENLRNILDFTRPDDFSVEEEVNEKGDASEGGIVYVRSTEVTPVTEDDWNGDGRADVVLVRVTVSYPQFLSGERASASLSTYIADSTLLTAEAP